ncbi:VanZ like family protein [Clostridium luticellarii]|jgi:glycopeptide antibiotics resistance protein|uniref:VanZ like family protein n=2 Tax=Clostridium luticellarii TaxID=1691940 RepID=A0A2T0BF71_9CLOT|nr:VanZ like family protein [Clostridium luticellarii]
MLIGDEILMFITVIKALAYEYLCLIFFCVIFQIIMAVEENKNGHKYEWKHFAWVYIFFIYLMLVFICTGTGNIHEFTRYKGMSETITRLTEINLVPFSSTSGGIVTHAANSVMFMPFGFLLPFIWRQFRSSLKVACTGLFFSLAIELSQLLNMRATDIDDLIMNTLGAFLGWMVFYLFKNKDRKPIDSSNRTKLSFPARHEAFFYLVLSFTDVFLLYNPFLF